MFIVLMMDDVDNGNDDDRTSSVLHVMVILAVLVKMSRVMTTPAIVMMITASTRTMR